MPVLQNQPPTPCLVTPFLKEPTHGLDFRNYSKDYVFLYALASFS
jgi:hypothetical protein